MGRRQKVGDLVQTWLLLVIGKENLRTVIVAQESSWKKIDREKDTNVQPKKAEKERRERSPKNTTVGSGRKGAAFDS